VTYLPFVCKECGETVVVSEEHSFVDCAVRVIEGYPNRPVEHKYARAVVEALRRQREVAA
jgi:hypothetical protein